MKLELKVGGRYRSREGKIVTIDREEEDAGLFYGKYPGSSVGRFYNRIWFKDGLQDDKKTFDDDLVEEAMPIGPKLKPKRNLTI